MKISLIPPVLFGSEVVIAFCSPLWKSCMKFTNYSLIPDSSFFWQKEQQRLYPANIYLFKDTLKDFNDFKNKQKSEWSNVFDMQKRVYSESVFNTLYIEIKNKFLDKIIGSKKAVFFLSRTPTYHSFSFNLRFLYELKHNICLSKTVCGIFRFRFRFVFIKGYIFIQQNARFLWL